MRGVTLTTSGALNKSALRQANERLVLNTIRQNPLVSRADILRIAGLAPISVTYIVGRLYRNTLICEQEVEQQSHLGRRSTGLRLRPEAKIAVAVEATTRDSRVVLADLNGDIVRKRTVNWHPNTELLFGHIHPAIQSPHASSAARAGAVMHPSVSAP